MPRKTLTPRITDLDIETVDTCQSLYESHLRATHSKSTADTYMYGVKSFDRWLSESTKTPDLTTVTEAVINRYMESLREVAKPGTVITYWSGLRSFYAWCVTRGFVSVNPMTHIKKPTATKTVIPNIPVDAIKRLLNSCDPNTYNGIRDRAIIMILFSTGMRRKELVGLTVDSYDRKHQTLKVTGKGDKERLVHVDESVRPILNRYLKIRELHGLASSTDAMWLGRSGGFQITAVIQMLNRRAKAAGLPADVKINPHAWRHTYAHNYLDNGGQLDTLMASAGWANMAMVERYARANREQRALRESERLNLGSLVC